MYTPNGPADREHIFGNKASSAAPLARKSAIDLTFAGLSAIIEKTELGSVDEHAILELMPRVSLYFFNYVHSYIG